MCPNDQDKHGSLLGQDGETAAATSNHEHSIKEK